MIVDVSLVSFQREYLFRRHQSPNSLFLCGLMLLCSVLCGPQASKTSTGPIVIQFYEPCIYATKDAQKVILKNFQNQQ